MTQASRILAVVGLVMGAALFRWIPHPPNFSPMIAIVLFSGTILPKRWMAFAVAFAALVLSDAVLGFYDFMWAIYLSYALVLVFTFAAHEWMTESKPAWLKLGVGSTAAALIFFAASNAAVWAFGSLYPKTMAGLWQSYVAALPFFQNTLVSTLAYSYGLFAAYSLIEKWAPKLAKQSV